MALANTGVQLARQGASVLLVDWDLEAPGLDRYFTNSEAADKGRVVCNRAEDPTGLMGWLHDEMQKPGQASDNRAWQRRLWTINVPPALPTFRTQTPPTPKSLYLLPSGYGSDLYADRVISSRRRRAVSGSRRFGANGPSPMTSS